MTVNDIVTEPSLRFVLQTAADAHDQADAFLTCLAEGIKAGEGSLTDESQYAACMQKKLVISSIAQLRGLHRTVNLNARKAKTDTAEARQKVDRLHLQLQNLYYEQRHLEGEITACESYDHKYQQLPLVSEEEFLAEHPEHVGADENILMAARIDHERVEREGLEQQRQELLRRKAKLIAENKKRKDDLANLDKDLEKFIDAAKPIQQRFEKVV